MAATRMPSVSPPRPRITAARLFDAEAADRYEDWFATPAGRRAEAEEQELLGGLMAWLGDPPSVLEVGCGTGRFTRWLAGRGHRAVGLDRSQAMLAESGRRAPGLPLVLADAQALPFRPGTFDVVFIVTTLEFVADPVAVLREAVQVARRGVVLGVLNRWSLAGLRRVWTRRSLRAAARLMRPAELHRLVREALGERLGEVALRVGVAPPGGAWLTRRLLLGEFLAMGVRLRGWPSETLAARAGIT